MKKLNEEQLSTINGGDYECDIYIIESAVVIGIAAVALGGYGLFIAAPFLTGLLLRGLPCE